MTSPGSVTNWINQLQDGDQAAAQKLWESYFQRLVRLARQKLGSLPRRAADEEDVALSAFDSFCRGAEQGRYPQLTDRDQLWYLLITITQRKALDLIEHEKQQKRDWRKVQYEAGPLGDSASSLDQVLCNLLSREPDPGFAAQVAEECQRLLDRLDDNLLRQIAVHKMEGYTNEEIAVQLECAVATVERRLRLIRKCWAQEFAETR